MILAAKFMAIVAKKFKAPGVVGEIIAGLILGPALLNVVEPGEFINQMALGYDSRIEQGGTNVSGGQKQRLCIARALLKRPKVLVLDDSTSACDTATDAKIQRAFREELPDMTKIIIAQRISSVERCDRILVMDNGVVTGFDTHEQLLRTNELYKEIYDIQTADHGDFDQKGGEA